jgi:hypothetical protein
MPLFFLIQREPQVPVFFLGGSRWLAGQEFEAFFRC